MAKHEKRDEVIVRWTAIPAQLRRVVRGLSDAQLDTRRGTERLSIRETVHHLVEANLVASNIIVAALANSGSTYDWTWVNPNSSWMRRLGYHKAPIGPALSTLSALSRHIAALLSVTNDRLQRTIQLFDAPGSPRYTKTISQILIDEVSHACEHLEAVRRPRARGSSSRGRRTTG